MLMTMRTSSLTLMIDHVNHSIFDHTILIMQSCWYYQLIRVQIKNLKLRQVAQCCRNRTTLWQEYTYQAHESKAQMSEHAHAQAHRHHRVFRFRFMLIFILTWHMYSSTDSFNWRTEQLNSSHMHMCVHLHMHHPSVNLNANVMWMFSSSCWWQCERHH